MVSVLPQDARRFFLGRVLCTNISKANTLLLMKELKLNVTRSGLIPVISDCLSFQFSQPTQLCRPAASRIEAIGFDATV